MIDVILFEILKTNEWEPDILEAELGRVALGAELGLCDFGVELTIFPVFCDICSQNKREREKPSI